MPLPADRPRSKKSELLTCFGNEIRSKPSAIKRVGCCASMTMPFMLKKIYTSFYRPAFSHLP